MPKMMKLKLLDARGNSRNAVPVSHGLALVIIPEMRLLQDPIAAIWRLSLLQYQAIKRLKEFMIDWIG
jgi:hypothetical protein